jgi:hypothetical protein
VLLDEPAITCEELDIGPKEFEEATVEELEVVEELDPVTVEELDVVEDFLATPLTAKSGAWPALSASRAPAR